MIQRATLIGQDWQDYPGFTGFLRFRYKDPVNPGNLVNPVLLKKSVRSSAVGPIGSGSWWR